MVIVAGTPLDFRPGQVREIRPEGRPSCFVVHVADSPGGLASHCPLAAGVSGGLPTAFFTALVRAGVARRGITRYGITRHGGPGVAAQAPGGGDASSRGGRPAAGATASDPIHPVRVYGELLKVLDDDAVVIGDGGDFVSFAGRHLEPRKPGGWLDPGPFGCLGTGLGYAAGARAARPSSQVVLLLGDGAAGMSLMDVDTLVRHKLPVVMVCGNNAGWGLEKWPMRAMFGYDVAADLAPRTRYDEVVRALGGAGELVTAPAQIGPALRRGFDSGVPYLVNVITDPEVEYPRTTTGV